MKNYLQKLSAILLLVSVLNFASAQILDFDNHMDIVLPKSKMTVKLYAAATSVPGQKSNNYYYLPCNLRLSTIGGKPAFLLLNYLSDKKLSGAIMSGMVEWGLTAEQEKELIEEVKKKNRNAKIMGAAFVKAMENGEGEGKANSTFTVVSATGENVQTGPIVTAPGVATPFKATFNGDNAAIFSETVTNRKLPLADLSMYMGFHFFTRVVGVKGKIIVDYEQLYKKSQQFKQSSSWKYKLIGPNSVNVSSSKAFLDSLYEKFGVRIIIDDNTALADPEKGKIIIQSFLDLFTQKIGAKPEEQLDFGTLRRPTDSLMVPNRDRYSIDLNTMENYRTKKKETYNIDYRVTVPMTYYIGANLKNWAPSINSCTDCIPAALIIKTIDDKIGVFQIKIEDDISSLISTGAVSLVSTSFVGKSKSGNKIFDKANLTDETFNYVKTASKGNEPFTVKMQIKVKGEKLSEPVELKNTDGFVSAGLGDFNLKWRQLDIEVSDAEMLKDSGYIKAMVIVEYKLFKAWKRKVFEVKFDEPTDYYLATDNESPILVSTMYLNKYSNRNILTKREEDPAIVVVSSAPFEGEGESLNAAKRFINEKIKPITGTSTVIGDAATAIEEFLLKR